MKLRANKMLGLAVGEKSMLIAEVACDLGRCQVVRCGVFPYSEGITPAQPQALGQALGNYLKQEGFSSKPAVFGIPAKWVLTKAKELPPVDPSLAPDMLRIQVESEFSAELKDLVYDYAGQSSATEASHVLLAAAPRRHVDTINAIADAARLDVQGIAPTGVVLSTATTDGTNDALVLSITPSGTELSARRGASPSLLRHVGSSAGVSAAVAGEVRRASLMMPRNGSTFGNGAANGHSHGQIVVWDDAGLDLAARRAITEALGPSARAGDFSSLGAGELPAGMSGCAAAVALAVAGISARGLPVDFQHSRLAPPKKAAIQRRTALAIAAAVIVVFGIVYAYVDLHKKELERATKLAELDRTAATRKAATAEVAMIRYAQGWHADTPRYLGCLRDLTMAIPDDGQMFVTSLNLHDTMKGDVVGKASSDRSVLTLVERLKASKKFSDVKMSLDTREARNKREVSFSIAFKYIP